jgi:signal transduction histidine kinase
MIVGLAVTVGIWLFAGYFFGQRISDLEQRTAAVSARYIQAQEQLTRARTDIILTSVYVRDALIYSEPRTLTENRRHIEAAFVSAEEALTRYTPVLADADQERAGVARLKNEIAGLRVTMLELLSGDEKTRQVRAGTVLQQSVLPKRQAALRIAEELQGLNRQAYVAHQTEVAAIYVATQQQVWLILGLAVVGSVATGLVSWLYTGRLERRIAQQRERDVLVTEDLQRLSSQIVGAHEEARRVIARELHDEVGQTLTAMKLELAHTRQQLVDAGQAPEVLDDLRQIADRALHAVRDLSHLLHPAMLDELGLSAAVDALATSLRRHGSGLTVELVSAPMETRANTHVELACYRLVQEALNNVVKHAAARSCRISIQRVGDALSVMVTDDGIGFVVDEVMRPGTQRGLGLLGMQERIHAVGGQLRIDSAPGRGTTITATFASAPADPSGPWSVAALQSELA